MDWNWTIPAQDVMVFPAVASLHSGKSQQNTPNYCQKKTIILFFHWTDLVMTVPWWFPSSQNRTFSTAFPSTPVLTWSLVVVCSRPVRLTEAMDGVSIGRIRTQTAGQEKNLDRNLNGWAQIPRIHDVCVRVCVCVWDCLVFSSSTWYTVPSALLTVRAGPMATFLSVWDIQQVSKSKPAGPASRLGRERLIFCSGLQNES